MSGVSDLQLEDLPGVEAHLISKLKRAGIQSVLDLAVSIPPELEQEEEIMMVVELQLTQKQYQILH